MKGQRVPKHYMRKRRGRADRREARCCQGVNGPGGALERGTAGEAVQLLGAGGTQSHRYRERPATAGRGSELAFRVRDA